MRQSTPIRLAVILTLITSLFCLTACFAAPPPPVQQKFFAESYFQGAALELAQAVDRKDGAAISRLIKQEGLNPDLIFDEHNMPFVAWPVLNENEEGLRLLLEAGANPNARRLYPLRKDSPGATTPWSTLRAWRISDSCPCCWTTAVIPIP